MNPVAKYNARADAVNSLVCVGLDSAIESLPAADRAVENPQFAFNRRIIEATHPYTAAYKLNSAFYEARGTQGWHELGLTVAYLRAHHPAIFTICDAKRADIGNTNEAYAVAILDHLGADAMTLHPYLGREALAPFLARRDKAAIILCRTSNPGAGELQDLLVDGRPLWQVVAEQVSREWNTLGNCMLVTGATYPAELRRIREIAPGITFLVPGVGAQGGEVAAAVQAGRDAAGKGLIVSSSRGIIFAPDPAAAARDLRDAINAARG